MGQRGQTTGFMFPTPRQAIPIPLDTIYENQQTAELEVRLASRSSLQIHPNVMWADVVKDIRFTNAADFSLSNPDSCQETMTCCYYGDTGYQSHMPYNSHLQKNRRNAHLDSLFTSKVRRWVRNISSHRNDSVNQAQCSCHLWSKKGFDHLDRSPVGLVLHCTLPAPRGHRWGTTWTLRKVASFVRAGKGGTLQNTGWQRCIKPSRKTIAENHHTEEAKEAPCFGSLDDTTAYSIRSNSRERIKHFFFTWHISGLKQCYISLQGYGSTNSFWGIHHSGYGLKEPTPCTSRDIQPASVSYRGLSA